jgi:hypothetical protein
MTESTLSQYRNAMTSSALAKTIKFLVDPTPVSIGREGSSSDGIHYNDEVYEVCNSEFLFDISFMIIFPRLYCKWW